MSSGFARVTDADAAVERLRAAVDAAEESVVLSVPSVVFAALRDALVGARDRGVLVVVLVGDADDLAVADAASVCREWSVAEAGLSIAALDRERTMVAAPGFLAGDRAGYAAFVDDDLVEDMTYSSFVGNFWPVARHVHAAEPAALPRTFEDFRHATVQAALHLRDGRELTATAWPSTADGDGVPADSEVPVDRDPESAVSGRVLNVRQSVVQPVTSSFPLENSLELETKRGRTSVGGPGAFVEDHAAGAVRLEHRTRD